MADKRLKEIANLSFGISFPNAPKSEKELELLFNKMRSLVKSVSFGRYIKIGFKKRRINFFAKNFGVSVSFEKRIIIAANVPNANNKKNLEAANKISNKVINYTTTIIGEPAKYAKVYGDRTHLIPKKITNLAEKILGEAKIAKINEITKIKLNPTIIGFDYKLKNQMHTILCLSNSKGAYSVISRITYRDTIPFDLLYILNKRLIGLEKTIKLLDKAEL